MNKRSLALAHRLRRLAWLAVVAQAAAPSFALAQAVAAYRVEGDGIASSLSSSAGDAARGRALIVARDAANCVLCHSFPDPALKNAGDLGPSLDGVGARLSLARLRLRIANMRRIDSRTIMPSYYRTEGLVLVAEPYRDKPILTAQEVEDVVAYLATLR